MVRRQRLLSEDVQRGAPEPAVLEHLDQRILVHDRAARRVDQQGGRLHPRESLAADQATAHRRQLEVDREHVRPRRSGRPARSRSRRRRPRAPASCSGSRPGPPCRSPGRSARRATRSARARRCRASARPARARRTATSARPGPRRRRTGCAGLAASISPMVSSTVDAALKPAERTLFEPAGRRDQDAALGGGRRRPGGRRARRSARSAQASAAGRARRPSAACARGWRRRSRHRRSARRPRPPSGSASV